MASWYKYWLIQRRLPKILIGDILLADTFATFLIPSIHQRCFFCCAPYYGTQSFCRRAIISVVGSLLWSRLKYAKKINSASPGDPSTGVLVVKSENVVSIQLYNFFGALHLEDT
jgi:hypothetical protein